MGQILSQIDRLLRGEFTRKKDLSAGRISERVAPFLFAALASSALYGLCMGLFAALRHPDHSLLQMASAALKVPLLFFLTLLVTGPSLMVFSALARSSLRGAQTGLLLLACTAVSTVVLASLGPVTVFFSLSTKSHPFMQILNVIVFTIAGIVGVAFLRKVMATMVERPAEESGRKSESSDPAAQRARRLLGVWFAIYAIVGAQMAWILRPFVGSPSRPIEFLRGTESNIFRGVLEALEYL